MNISMRKVGERCAAPRLGPKVALERGCSDEGPGSSDHAMLRIFAVSQPRADQTRSAAPLTDPRCFYLDRGPARVCAISRECVKRANQSMLPAIHQGRFAWASFVEGEDRHEGQAQAACCSSGDAFKTQPALKLDCDARQQLCRRSLLPHRIGETRSAPRARRSPDYRAGVNAADQH